MHIPFIGRLRGQEWPVLFLSIAFVFFESFIHIITLFLPRFLLELFDKAAKLSLSTFSEVEDSDEIKKIRDLTSFVDICNARGYESEVHYTATKDGFLLALHRITGRTNQPPNQVRKPVVYLHHGLLMCSEVWVVNENPKLSLAFALSDFGYDVWLGNNRGNKYSKKHLYCIPSQTQFWNFCIDDFALYDIPNSIDFILNATGCKSLAYIGFSQGSAQAFASLSIHPELNRKVSAFIAIAPAMSPPGLSNKIADSLMKASPMLLFLLFGRKAILSSTMFWQYLVTPELFIRVIDVALYTLFNWKSKHITHKQKLIAYFHLYSTTSVKSVVHWFQVLKNQCFQMYDDDPSATISLRKGFYEVTKFPTKNITTPITLIYGEIDSLANPGHMAANLPTGTDVRAVPDHEHLDLIWGDDVDKVVFPSVFQALEASGSQSPVIYETLSSHKSLRAVRNSVSRGLAFL
ncbi:hypothetical protein CANCADRAFT_82015 [Tortispora caseinolytica NRRL Y-17796]|uniref:AB hydrolase-1 domain-containing protein n=1 Tax=Tortispora caseinolytica NRRL Y-17796 TaxID=767744 RepID=A0A1E4TK03_9ASCO|nr:hypothetical protein CANCADRAFT_82015 [Tortispora caseinolytica NRRL Y-17796]